MSDFDVLSKGKLVRVKREGREARTWLISSIRSTRYTPLLYRITRSGEGQFDRPYEAHLFWEGDCWRFKKGGVTETVEIDCM